MGANVIQASRGATAVQGPAAPTVAQADPTTKTKKPIAQGLCEAEISDAEKQIDTHYKIASEGKIDLKVSKKAFDAISAGLTCITKNKKVSLADAANEMKRA